MMQLSLHHLVISQNIAFMPPKQFLRPTFVFGIGLIKHLLTQQHLPIIISKKKQRISTLRYKFLQCPSIS